MLTRLHRSRGTVSPVRSFDSASSVRVAVGPRQTLGPASAVAVAVAVAVAIAVAIAVAGAAVRHAWRGAVRGARCDCRLEVR